MIISAVPDARAFMIGNVQMKLRGAAGYSYDDNITFVHADKTKDTITSLAGGLSVLIDRPLRQFELSGVLTHEMFSENSRFDNTAEDALLIFKNEFTPRNRIRLRNAFSHTYEPRNFVETFGRAGGRFSYYRNRLNLDYDHDLSSQFRLTAKYGNEMDRTPQGDLQNSFLNMGGLQGTYEYSSSFALNAQYQYHFRQFDPGNANATMNRATGGLRKYFTPQLYLDAEGGANFIQNYNGRALTRPHYEASLANDFSEASRGSIAFIKDDEYNHYAQDVFDFWRATAQWQLQISERLSTQIAGYYGEGTYSSFNLDDKVGGGSATLAYDILLWLKAAVNYTFTNFRSNDVLRAYDKNRGTVSLTAEF